LHHVIYSYMYLKYDARNHEPKIYVRKCFKQFDKPLSCSPFPFWEILLRKLWRLCKVVIAVDWHVFGITGAWRRRHESRISLRIWLDISGTWHFLYTSRDRGNMEEHTRDRGWLLSLIRKHNRYRSVTLLRREVYMRTLKLCNRSRFIIGLYKDIIATADDSLNSVLRRVLQTLLCINCCTQSYPHVSIVTSSVLITVKLQSFEITDNFSVKCITGQYYQLVPKLVHFTDKNCALSNKQESVTGVIMSLLNPLEFKHIVEWMHSCTHSELPN
jgi:hypothetical protein